MKGTLAERLEHYSIPEPNSGCVLWIGRVNAKGYGTMRLGGWQWLAHRVAWIAANGPIPDGLCVLHRCDNPPCVRPSHLSVGTQLDNIRDRDAKGRTARQLGERNGLARLTGAKVAEIRSAFRTGEKVTSLVLRHGVSQATIYRVLRNKIWKED